jgi:hypothetical protein
MANRLRRREVKYFEKLATKYRVKTFEFDSPYNASVLSIPDYVPPPMPNPGPGAFNCGHGAGGPPPNPFRPSVPEVDKTPSEDQVIVIEELDHPAKLEEPIQAAIKNK